MSMFGFLQKRTTTNETPACKGKREFCMILRDVARCRAIESNSTSPNANLNIVTGMSANESQEGSGWVLY